jgi:hypothetical protein
MPILPTKDARHANTTTTQRTNEQKDEEIRNKREPRELLTKSQSSGGDELIVGAHRQGAMAPPRGYPAVSRAGQDGS